MTAEINSLKKDRWGTAAKNTKPKPTGKKQATKKVPPQKMKDQTNEAIDKWAWKSKPPKEMDNKEDNVFIKIFEDKKYYWCINPNNGTGMWTLHHPKDCEASKLPLAQWPMPTLPLLTLWTATLIKNDSCTRIKFFLGSGLPSQTTFYGWCSPRTWECQSPPSSSRQSSLLSSFSSASIQRRRHHTYQRNVGLTRASGSSPCLQP